MTNAVDLRLPVADPASTHIGGDGVSVRAAEHRLGSPGSWATFETRNQPSSTATGARLAICQSISAIPSTSEATFDSFRSPWSIVGGRRPSAATSRAGSAARPATSARAGPGACRSNASQPAEPVAGGVPLGLVSLAAGS